MATETTAVTSADPIAVAVSTRDSDTPARSTHKKPFMGFLAYPNGAHKRHYPIVAAAEVAYKECMRNHAAAIGGHALDGCCEFMPSPEFDPSDPTSLRCAACSCHRNFHRRDPDDPAPLHLHRHRPAPATPPFFFSSSAPPHFPPPATAPASGKKRVRTKFSEDQKEKMIEFSGRFGWKMQKIEKGVIEDFCNEVGVGREVLKVWLHNNKNKRGSVVIHGGDGGGRAHNANDQFQHFHHLGSSGDGSSSSSG